MATTASKTTAKKSAPPRRTRAAVTSAVTLAVDVGGSGVKAEALSADGTSLGDRQRIPVSYPVPPEKLVDYVRELAGALPKADRVAVGFPGMVRAGLVLSAPHFVSKRGPGRRPDPDLVTAWDRFDLAGAVQAALGLPVRVGNDADVAGLAVVSGQGLELVVTLGTGFGTALFHNGLLAPHLELAHHPFRKSETYNEQVGDAARRAIGDERWTRRVVRAVQTLRALTFYDRLYVGGGNARRLTSSFREPATIVDNVNGILGGLRLWEQPRVI